ncbi:TIGR04222 domain-containing membrane protein [Streptomyces pathocidini]|uniref:TIGR04222 domain-containing membrane protein n=1 Tax=Streptomyces pathocidini TaxID=1650571 RepID=A0ABW7UJV6_9ACTN
MWVLLLLVGSTAVIAASARLCHAVVLACLAPERTPGAKNGTARRGHFSLSLYEAAFLAGGPRRVADLALVSMAGQRRLLLAHTGWATVVDPEGRDEVERSVIRAIGPDGQSRIPAVRATLTAADAVRSLADRLVAAGLAVPPPAVANLAAAIRQVQLAGVLALLCGFAALATLPAEGDAGPVAAWFALPLALVTGCLAITHAELHPTTRWASPAGQHLLGRLAATPPRPCAPGQRDTAAAARTNTPTAPADPAAATGPAAPIDPDAATGPAAPTDRAALADPAALASFALHGSTALTDPDLKAALRHRRHHAPYAD